MDTNRSFTGDDFGTAAGVFGGIVVDKIVERNIDFIPRNTLGYSIKTGVGMLGGFYLQPTWARSASLTYAGLNARRMVGAEGLGILGKISTGKQRKMYRKGSSNNGQQSRQRRRAA